MFGADHSGLLFHLQLVLHALLFYSQGAPGFRIVLWGLSEGILLGFLLLQQLGQAMHSVPCLLNNNSENCCSPFSKTQEVSSPQTTD